MPLNRVLRDRQFGGQRSPLQQGLTPLSQPGQQPVDGRGSAGPAGIELTDAITGERHLLLQQLFVLLRN